MIRNRFTAAGITGALALGSALVATAPAEAAALDTSYTCQTSFGPQTFNTKVTLDIPASAPISSAVPSRPVSFAVTLPGSLVAGLKLLGVTDIEGTASNASYKVGTQSVPLSSITIPKTTLGTGDTILTGTGTAEGFTAPADRGTYAIEAPSSFTFTAKDQNGGELISNSSCTIAGSGKIADVQATGTASTTTAKAKPKKVTTAKKVKLKVSVAATGVVPTGKVTATIGKKVKTGTLANGKVKINLGKLKAGKRKVVLNYEGDTKVEPSTTKIKIKVKEA